MVLPGLTYAYTYAFSSSEYDSFADEIKLSVQKHCSGSDFSGRFLAAKDIQEQPHVLRRHLSQIIILKVTAGLQFAGPYLVLDPVSQDINVSALHRS